MNSYQIVCYLLSLVVGCVSVHIGLDFKNLVDDEAVLRSLTPNLRKTFLKERLIYNLTFGGGRRIFTNIIIPVPKFHIRVMLRGYSLTLPPQPKEVAGIEYYGRLNYKARDYELMRNLFEGRHYGVFYNVGAKWLYLNYFQEFSKHDILYCTIIANITNATHQERFVRRFFYRLSKHVEYADAAHEDTYKGREEEIKKVQQKQLEMGVFGDLDKLPYDVQQKFDIPTVDNIFW